MQHKYLKIQMKTGVDLSGGEGERGDLHVHRAQQAWGVRTQGDPARC